MKTGKQYIIETQDKQVRIICDTFFEMEKIIVVWKKKDIKYHCYERNTKEMEVK